MEGGKGGKIMGGKKGLNGRIQEGRNGRVG
jgi:hypothetical protein